MKRIALEPAMVPASIRGSYSGKRFFAVITDQVTIPADAGLWSGGSRDTYDMVSWTGTLERLSDHYSSPWDNTRTERKVTLTPGFAVRRYCQGMYSELTFFIHPDTANKMLLAAPKAELTANESIVLKASKELKSSYNGMDRFEMCKRDWEYAWRKNPPFMSRNDWVVAKTLLISKGLLNKAGAITVKGRNAVTEG